MTDIRDSVEWYCNYSIHVEVNDVRDRVEEGGGVVIATTVPTLK